MGAVVGIVAFAIAVIGLLAALGHVGYLAMLNSAARKRGASGAYAVDFVNGRWKAAGVTAAVSAFALLLTAGGVPADVLAIVLGGGAGLLARNQLESTRQQFRNQA